MGKQHLWACVAEDVPGLPRHIYSVQRNEDGTASVLTYSMEAWVSSGHTPPTSRCTWSTVMGWCASHAGKPDANLRRWLDIEFPRIFSHGDDDDRVDTDAMMERAKQKALRTHLARDGSPKHATPPNFWKVTQPGFYDAQGARVPPPAFQVAGPWLYSNDRDGKAAVLCVGCGVVGDGSTHHNKCPHACPGCNRTVCHGWYTTCVGVRGHTEDGGTRLQHIKDLTKPPPAMVMVDDNSEPV